MEGETLLCAIDTAIDDAEYEGRIRVNRRDPKERELFRAIRVMGAPVFLLPPEPQPPMTAVMVMDSNTLKRLSDALHQYGSSLERGLRYAGVPIKVDDDADGRILIVSLTGAV